jgi:hypothetical protein
MASVLEPTFEDTRAELSFRCDDGLVKARLYEMCVLSPYIRGLIDDCAKSAEGFIIDASDFCCEDVEIVVNLLHQWDKVVVHTCDNTPSQQESQQEPQQEEACDFFFNLSHRRLPGALVKFAHKYGIEQVLSLCRMSVNRCPDICEIILIDGISLDASWAQPAVVDYLVKWHVDEHSNSRPNVKLIPKLSSALMFRVLESVTLCSKNSHLPSFRTRQTGLPRDGFHCDR